MIDNIDPSEISNEVVVEIPPWTWKSDDLPNGQDVDYILDTQSLDQSAQRKRASFAYDMESQELFQPQDIIQPHVMPLFGAHPGLTKMQKHNHILIRKILRQAGTFYQF